ncbi:NAD(P)H-dependent oxidoreductase [Candidatus Woesearchaeota archaeon]|nr:NAD(P)H-dependent oxidoreductase [Candidatus Woesearchaeota archaeon]
MKDLIIYTHPGGEGHCNAILKAVQKQLKNYEVLDLYKMKFDPVLTKTEITDGIKQAKITDIQKKIKNSDRMIFIYPFWWGGMPAILKGFFDRVFSNGFAFTSEGKMPKGLLGDKQALIFMTSGAPNIFHLISGYRGIKVVEKDILGMCDIKTKSIIIGSCSKIDGPKKMKIRKIVRKSLR